MSDSSAAQAVPSSNPIEVPVHAARPCDLVLKGGIASGIVYPDAVRKLATEFHFMGIAGTSAGAIVASIAAAAEYRRRKDGSTAGYEVLDHATKELMQPGKMLELFAPDASTHRGFQPLKRSLDGSGKLRTAIWLISRVLLRHGWLPLLVFLITAGLSSALGMDALCGFALSSAGTLLALTVFLGSLLIALLRNGRAWKNNNYGFCSGTGKGVQRSPGHLPPLSHWLHLKIQEAAGLPLDEPLTFKQLHEAPPPKCLSHKAGVEGFRSIDFRAITTCLTMARPFEFPLNTNMFAYRTEDLELVFPEDVTRYLDRRSDAYVERRRKAKKKPHWQSSRSCAKEGTKPLPPSKELPIVMAARMSLSFPGLLSMVKLWIRDYGGKPKASSGKRRMQPLWFSDGGITSNLPISRFDSALCNWPTLAINLLYHRETDRMVDGADRGQQVYLPKIADSGNPSILYPWVERKGLFTAVQGWFMGMFTSAQVWSDNNFVQMRSSRERIVEVWLTQKEGGTNLNMDLGDMEDLLDRGVKAAELLIERFADAPHQDVGRAIEANSWDQYRWLRLRAAASALSDTLRQFAGSFDRPLAIDRPWREFFELNKLEFRNYPPDKQTDSNEKAQAMLKDLEDLVQLAHAWDLLPLPTKASEDRARFGEGPRPRAVFRAQGPLNK